MVGGCERLLHVWTQQVQGFEDLEIWHGRCWQWGVRAGPGVFDLGLGGHLSIYVLILWLSALSLTVYCVPAQA